EAALLNRPLGHRLAAPDRRLIESGLSGFRPAIRFRRPSSYSFQIAVKLFGPRQPRPSSAIPLILPCRMLSVIRRPISFARPDDEIGLSGADANAAVGAVARGVARVIAERVLMAQLLGDE